MLPPDRREGHKGPQEQEAHKDARVFFHGVVASPFNLQGVRPTVDLFDRAAEQSIGRKILYMEAPTSTPEASENSKMVIRHHGLVDPLLGNIYRQSGISPRTQDDLDRLRQKIDDIGIPRSLETGLVP